MRQPQFDLFDVPPDLPPGFRYRPDLIDAAEERRLIGEIERLNLRPFDFHGFAAKRRVVAFGWRYDFNGGGLQRADDLPAFILPARDLVARRFGLPPAELQQALLIDYPPGAALGWHRDRDVFGVVAGLSLAAPCTFRFRRKAAAAWQRRSLVLAPRSAYCLQGPARHDWEHSIPPVEARRYAITFRTLKSAA